MQSSTKKKLLTGVITGLLTPPVFSPVVAAIFYAFFTPRHFDEFGFVGQKMGFWEFYLANFESTSKLTVFMSLCVLVNLGVFFWLLKKRQDEVTSRGVIFATLMYAIVVFYYKLDSF
jgi:hypothetical protein